MTQKQLVLPADYPVALLRSRAIEHLTQELDRAVLSKTGRPIRVAGLLIGLLLLVSYFDTVVGGFFSGFGRVFLNASQIAMAAAIIGCLGWAHWHGRRLQNEFRHQCDSITDLSLCPLSVLNARLEDIQNDSDPAVEPKEILAGQLIADQRALRAARTGGPSAADVLPGVVAPPALSETVAPASPKAAISL